MRWRTRPPSGCSSGWRRWRRRPPVRPPSRIPSRPPRSDPMLKVTWRNLVARKLRLLLSAFAIILGVAFVAGTLVFTNAMGGAFDDIIEGSTADTEIAYKGADDFSSAQDARTLPA